MADIELDEQPNDRLPQAWDEEGFPRYLARQFYETFAPTKALDILWAALWMVVAIVIRVSFEIPASWPDRADLLTRVVVAYAVASYTTLFLAYSLFYLARLVNTVRRRTAA
jgi:hypothetical protein